MQADFALHANVHPTDWVNPVAASCYNLVVIGGGTAGLVAAAGAAGLGARVALIERHLLGGDCLNVGCVPSKALLAASRALHAARWSAAFGVRGTETLAFDFAATMSRMRHVRTELSHHDAAHRFRDDLGVDVFFGTGRFVAPDRIDVAGQELRFRKAAICAGGRPVLPAVPGLSADKVFTNETIFNLTELPPRLAVIGGGPLGCELAQAFARFGSRVTVIEKHSGLLGGEDREAAEVLQAIFRREGIDLRFNTRILDVTTRHREKLIRLIAEGREDTVAADAILVAAGRAPAVDDLGLETAGIAGDRSGIRITDTLRTTNPRVYAAGDVCSSRNFTHVADAQARIVVANALFLGRRKSTALTVPWCTYTDPEIAHVGLYEAEASARGLSVTTLSVPLAEVDRAILDGTGEGFARVHLRKGTDRILGATIVARQAGEMINEFTLAMSNGLGLGAIARTIHPYPTQAEVVKKLGDAWYRSRLTPGFKSLASRWLAWQRG